jgi:hypothetical protein
MNTPTPPNQNNNQEVTYFAKADYRNRNKKFGIKKEDRTRHMYVIGKTGMGKTTLLENMAVQDIHNGNGLAFIDPHGEVADNLLDFIPKERAQDVMYFAPFDLDHPISFNVMEDVGPDRRHLVADGLLSAFKKIWVDMWSGRMEYLLNNALLALLEYPDATILGVNRMFADKEYRKRVVTNVTDVSVKSFWRDEFAEYDERFQRQAASAIQNKVGQFVSNPQVRNIVGQTESSFDVRSMMDEGKIMLINLSKGQVGEDNARLIGSMLITKMYLAAMSRADTGTGEGDLSQLRQFYFYVDEFQSFANESFAGILSEARKYKLNLIIAHQYIEQMTEDVRNAVFGNVGTMITFRVGAFDAEVLEKEFQPVFDAEDLVNLGFAQIYLKLMLNGVSSKPFSAKTLPPIEPDHQSHREEIRELSREKYGRPREEVEEEINKWHDSTYGIVDDERARAMADKQRAIRKGKYDPQSNEEFDPDKHLDKDDNKSSKKDSKDKSSDNGGGNKSQKSQSSKKDKDKNKNKNKGNNKDGNKKQAKHQSGANSTSDKSSSESGSGSKTDKNNKQNNTDKNQGDDTQKVEAESAVSLSDLEDQKNNSQNQPEDKGPTEASRNKLKQALSGIEQSSDSNLGEDTSSKEEPSSESSQDKPSIDDSNPETVPTPEDTDTPAEIPEGELREMLEVEEESSSE